MEALGADLEVALLLFAAAIGTGLAAGVLAGLLGVGGGIVIVPMLYWLLPVAGVDESVRMHLAVGTSLATIIPTAIVSALAHRRRGAVDIDLLRTYAPGIVVGVLIGAAFGVRAGGSVLTLIFATVALVIAADMALRRNQVQVAPRPVRGLAAQGIGAVIGAVSAVMGIGGGTLSVPAFTLMGVPVHRAVGTAAAIGLIIAIPGAIGFMLGGLDDPHLPPGSVGYVNLLAFLAIVPATMLAAPHGVRLAHAISPKALRLAFAFFLLVTALRMFQNTLVGGGG
ncbi:MAG: sulfite exporter TauE/SafE family protein [Rhodospirillales bacterium]|nr:MAG: sulfite exporter TauE/SafE family protein [Rhodospirillales bacterium]